MEGDRVDEPPVPVAEGATDGCRDSEVLRTRLASSKWAVRKSAAMIRKVVSRSSGSLLHPRGSAMYLA